MAPLVSISSGDHRARLLARRDALVETHLELVREIARGLARSLPKRFEFDDLLQSGMVGLLHAATRYRPEAHGDTPFSAYARPVIRGAILDSVRRGKWVEAMRPSVEALELPDPAHTPDMEAQLDAQREAVELASAVAELPERERLVVNLYYRANVALPEVGRTLGVSKSRASQIHCDAVRRLRADRRLELVKG